MCVCVCVCVSIIQLYISENVVQSIYVYINAFNYH